MRYMNTQVCSKCNVVTTNMRRHLQRDRCSHQHLRQIKNKGANKNGKR